jgi:xanthine dehydrogenase accessory factor
MHSSDLAVLEALSIALDAGDFPWLCLIESTVGSAPRPVGTLLAVLPSGELIGSLSGGCVEEHLVERLLAGEFGDQLISRVEFGIDASQNARLGLPCGGRLVVLVQRLTHHDQEWITAALKAIAEHSVLFRSLDTATGESQYHLAPHFQPLSLDGNVLTHGFGPRFRLLLVGAGQLAADVATLALAMDYEVILTDSREDALSHWQGPSIETILGFPDDVVKARAQDPLSAVITLSHDPRVDDLALLEALESEAWYIGALGSARTSQQRRARLTELGVTQAALDRLHAPVGLDIGSKTTIEIAVSIMAQLTALRSQT